MNAGAGERAAGAALGPRGVWGAALLAVLVLGVYGQTATFGFSSYDDTIYVSENPVITAGLTWDGLREVFLHGHHLLWTPLTSLSYMIGCAVYGISPMGHHLSSVALHFLASWLVFYTLWRYTQSLGVALVIAAIFAVHPLNVESVAWVSSRKNQLYTIFWMLSFLAYRRYTLAPSVRGYLGVAALHLCGLASKPTHLMLPVVLLLVDAWPLWRMEPRPYVSRAWLKCVGRLVLEKIPLLALSAAVAVWTLGTVQEAGGMRDLAAVSLAERLANTAYVYAFFVAKLFWPTGLTVHYPYPVGGIARGVVWTSAAMFLALSVLSLVSLFRARVFFVGWWWYVLVLFPESGLLRANSFLMADRYAYVSTLGLLLTIVWPLRNSMKHRAAMASLAMLVLGLGVWGAWQTRFWHDDLALFGRSAALYPDSPVAHNSLGLAQMRACDNNAARQSFQQALAAPGNFKVLPTMNLGVLAMQEGTPQAALQHFDEVRQRNPSFPLAYCWAARAQVALGNLDVAKPLLDAAAVLAPNDPEVLRDLAGRTADPIPGRLLIARGFLNLGHAPEALEHFNQVLQIDPDQPEALLGAWAARMGLDDAAGAEVSIRRYLDRHADDSKAWAALAMSLKALGQNGDAKTANDHALALDPTNPQALKLQGQLQPVPFR